MKLSSSAFENKNTIPKKFGYNHENINPSILIEDVPQNTKSLVLIMDDPDALSAVGKIWTHWIVWNISPDTKIINENSIPQNAIEGTNDFEQIGYGGPAPPDKKHTYVFTMYSIDIILENKKGSSKNDILTSIENHIVEQAQLFGTFEPT